MDSTPKSNLKTSNSNKKQIKLPFDADSLFVSDDQLTKIPKREDDNYLAGDLVWVKTKGFPWWACMITVDPQTGKYSKTVVIRNKNEKVFHVQYFGSKPFRGYTEGNIMKYDGKEKYELKLDQIKNTPTPNKSQRKQELQNYEIKPSSRKEWSIACDEADEAMKLDRVKRIEQLTFQYIVDKPKSLIKQEEKKTTPAKSIATPVAKASTSKKRKIDIQNTTISTGKKTPSAKRKKKTTTEKNSPGDVYDFNDFSDEIEDETPKKPFQLSSAKRAKGEYEIYAKKERAIIEKENPELDDNEVEQKLKKNWNIMSEDMRNNYSPKPSYSNLSFQLDSPSSNNMNTSKTALDTSSSKKIKTYSGLKRGRKPSSANKKENDFEKENTVDKEESSDEESTPTTNEKKTDNRRSSSRKKLFNQGNEANNDKLTSAKKRQSIDSSPISSKRRSARMSTGAKIIKTPPTTPIKKSTTPIVSTQKQQKSSAKKNNQLEEATNNISDESGSESEKIDLKETDDKNKEKYCGKCNEVGKNLIKCDGDCLTYYHKECLHKEESSS